MDWFLYGILIWFGWTLAPIILIIVGAAIVLVFSEIAVGVENIFGFIKKLFNRKK